MYMDIIQMFLTFITTVILFFTLIYTLRLSKKNKAVDVMLRCQERYDQITWRYKDTILKSDIPEIHFYDRFWELQIEQFQYWQKGYITDEIFEHWMFQRKREWAENNKIKKLSYQDGWKKIYGFRVDNKYTQFMERIFQGEIVEVMKKYKHIK
jgi:hypothetical protein